MHSLFTAMRLRADAGDAARKVTWLELFFDLVFVAAVAQVAEPLREHYGLGELVRFTPLMALIWLAWTGHTIFATRFDSDDATQRLLTLVQMFVVAVMAANASDALDSRSSAGFAAAYAVLRLLLVAQYFRARRLPTARALATRHLAGHGAAALLWLVSALVPAPLRFWLWALAFVIDLGTPWAALRHSVHAPPDASHAPERFGLFTIVLLGEAVVAVMQGMKSQEAWPASAALSAFLGMSTLFMFWWWYFDGAAAASHHPVHSRRDALRFQIWTYAHFPLAIGLVVAGVGINRIVTSAARAHLEPEEVWMVTGAMTVTMLAITLIGVVSDSRRSNPARSCWPQGALAGLTLLIGATGAMSAPAALSIAIALATFGQLALAVQPTQPGRVGDAVDAV